MPVLFGLTLTYSVLILALLAGNGFKKSLLFQDFRCLQDQEGSPPPDIYTQLPSGYFCPRPSVEAVTVEEESLSSLDRFCRLSTEN